MRIAVPSDDGVTIAGHTGRTRGFIVFDLENGIATKLDYRTNRYTPHAQGKCEEHETGGAHPHHEHQHSHNSLLDALQDCEVLLAHGMGPRLVADLAERNIRVIFCEDQLAADAAKKLAAGLLVSTGKSLCKHS
jgi:predicted Fe-Mo cluster-binding NifX family protein